MEPKLKWGFSLEVNNGWFDSFADKHAGVDIAILRDEWDAAPTQYIWSSPHLSELTDPAAVCRRAVVLKTLYDGALLLTQHRAYTPRPLGDLIDVENWQRIGRVSVEASDTPPFAAGCRLWRQPSILISLAMNRPVSRYLFLARFDDVACGMLRFLGVNGVTWITLYALKDFMGTHGWTEDDMANAAKVPKKKIEVFRRTANSYAVIGPFARHGPLKQEPPPDPMSLEDAATVILRAVRGFLEGRCVEFDLPGQAKAASW